MYCSFAFNDTNIYICIFLHQYTSGHKAAPEPSHILSHQQWCTYGVVPCSNDVTPLSAQV